MTNPMPGMTRGPICTSRRQTRQQSGEPAHPESGQNFPVPINLKGYCVALASDYPPFHSIGAPKKASDGVTVYGKDSISDAKPSGLCGSVWLDIPDYR
jgi:hypothetical protein